ncbi:MAG: phenylacetate--CoA ligase family protein [Candidatus Aenigmarchaeota archaeon]|nr:phenylacetate--CoA ligase family protein [Candidatus Aenigmarchaeota archaeon]
MKNQWIKKKELGKLQDAMLRRLILHSYKNVPFYRKLWDAHSVNISKIKTAEDLDKLPIVTKQDVLKNRNSMIAVNYRKTHEIGNFTTRATSGTSGNPVEVIFDERANDYLEAVYLRGLLAAGYRPWTPLVYYWWTNFESRIYNRFGLMNKVRIPCSLTEDDQLKMLQNKNTGYIYYYGGILHSIAQKMLHLGINIDAQMVVTHAELVTNRMRKTISKAFGVEPFDQYGTTEFNRLAWQCEQRENYHVDADSIALELSDDNTAIVTGMANYILPLIRYDMGDVLEISGEGCPCGRTLPTIKNICGRKEDVIKLKSGKAFAASVIADEIAKFKDVYKFSAIYNGNNRFYIKLAPFTGHENLEEAMEKSLTGRLKEDVKVRIKILDEIAKSKRGKRKLVSVEIP